MAGQTFFVTNCRICSGAQQLPIQMLGRETACCKCNQKFVATDANAQSAALDDPLKYWIRFTDHIYSKDEFETCYDRDIARTPR